MKFLIGRGDLAAAAIEAARATTPGLEIERLQIRPVNRGFRSFVNDAATDVSELAIVTLLQALAYEKPVALLPIATLSRHQHATLLTLQDRTVSDLPGATVGIRSWSQTTGVWVRGFLAHEDQLDLRAVDWVVYEGAHVSEHVDPEWVRRAPAGADLDADFLGGRLDYAIFGSELPADPRVHPAIPDADRAAAAFFQREGFVPVNHVVATTLAAARAHGETLCAMYDAMAAVIAGSPADPNDPGPVGFEAMRAPFTVAGEYAFEQGVLPRRVAFDEVVEASCEALGVPASRLGGGDQHRA